MTDIIKNKNLQNKLAKLKALQSLSGKAGKVNMAKGFAEKQLTNKLAMMTPPIRLANLAFLAFKTIMLVIIIIMSFIASGKSKSMSSTSLSKVITILSYIILVLTFFFLILGRFTQKDYKIGLIYLVAYTILSLINMLLSKQNKDKVSDNEKEAAGHVYRSNTGIFVMSCIMLFFAIIGLLLPFGIKDIFLTKYLFSPGI